MRARYRSDVIRFTWDLVARLPRPERAVTARHVTDDAAAEATFGLPAGQLTDARRRAGRVFMELVDGAICGLAVFSPTFPGAFPFRLAHASLARPLLEALRAHALPGDDRMGVVVEDDDALTDSLLSVGAAVHARMLHYEGPLPPKRT
jgi:hypothetical protein